MTLPRKLMLLALVGSTAGCATVGPDFVPPRADWDEGWTSATLASLSAPPPGADAPPWWRQFNDPTLDALVDAAMAGNRNLKVAGLRVLEARAQLGVAQSGLKPQQVQATGSAGYGASAPGGVPIGRADFAYATAGFNAAWELDVWGRFRRGRQLFRQCRQL